MSDSSIISQNEQKSKSTPNKFTWKKFGLICACLAWTAGIFIGVEFLVALIMTWILGDQITQPIWNAAYGAISYSLALAIIIGVPYFVNKRWRSTRAELGLKGMPTWTDIGLGIAGILAYFILASIVIWLCSLIMPWIDMSQAQDVGFNAISNNIDRLVAFVALVIVAPIAEEIIFRGWLYGNLRKIIPGKVSMPIAMLLVSILFGALHGQWNVAINVFALSIILCSLRELTGTIYSGILVHMIKNGIAFYSLYILGMGL